MAETRYFKEIETKVHDELYNNLYLLRGIYKTTPEFDRIFKKDMFVKNNKAAFHEVVHYLLDILNPQLTKERLTTWPPFEVKGENKFRTEVLKYVNELNNLYKHANIPPIMSSHLISPGGLKFTRFMLKLSQLVIYEHLKKKHNADILFSPEPDKNSDVAKRFKNNLMKVTLHNESKSRDMLDHFQEYHKCQKAKAELLVDTVTQLDKSISVSKKDKAIAEDEFYKKYTVYPSDDSLKSKLTYLKQEWQSLESIHKLYGECKDFLHYIHNNLTIDISENVKTMNGPIQENLPELFNTLTSLINSKSLELPNPDNSYIEETSAKLQDIADYANIKKDMLVEKGQMQVKIEQFFKNLKYMEYLTEIQPIIEEFSDDLQGIKPLEDSPN